MSKMMNLPFEAHLSAVVQRCCVRIICHASSLSLGLHSHQIQNKGPTNVSEHTQQEEERQPD